MLFCLFGAEASAQTFPGLASPGQVLGNDGSLGNGAQPSFPIAGRIRLTADTTFYVNNSLSASPCGAFSCSPGSDVTFCGLTPQGPCQTLAFAVASISNEYDFVHFTVIFQVADGTYNECIVLPDYIASYNLNQTATITGNASTPTNVNITCTTQGVVIARNIGSRWQISNLQITGTSSRQCIVANSANLYVGPNTYLNNCSIAMQAENAGGIVTIAAGTIQIPSTVSGENIFSVNNGGEIAGNGVVVINGAANLTYNASARASSTGFIDLTGISFTGFSGVTAQKYQYADYTGYIVVAGGDPNTALPGNTNGTPTPLPVLNGGTGVTTIAGVKALATPGQIFFTLTGVNFNSASTDNIVPLTNFPAGMTRFQVTNAIISNASHTLVTATAGIFGTTGGGSPTIAADQAITVSSTSDATSNNSENMALTGSATTSYVLANLAHTPNLYVRIGTPEGAAATADVTLILRPLP